MKKFLLTCILIATNSSFAQDLSSNYKFTIKSKNFKGEIIESRLETIGFLPIYDNHRDEIIIGNQKFIKETFLNIQILDEKNNVIKVNLDYKSNEKKYQKTIELNNGKNEIYEDFEIKVEKK